MRAVLSLCGLLLALFWVTRLAGFQLTALSGATPRKGLSNATKTSGATDASSAPGATASQQRAAQITQALEQAAAQRADDAASR